MASSSNAQYNLSAYFPMTTYKDEDGETKDSIDFFNPDGAKFVNSLTSVGDFQWDKSLKLDVLAHTQFGTVSAWWLPLFFNGAQHPGELKTGSFISIPRPTTRVSSTKSQSPGRGSRVLL